MNRRKLFGFLFGGSAAAVGLPALASPTTVTIINQTRDFVIVETEPVKGFRNYKLVRKDAIA